MQINLGKSKGQGNWRGLQFTIFDDGEIHHFLDFNTFTTVYDSGVDPTSDCRMEISPQNPEGEPICVIALGDPDDSKLTVAFHDRETLIEKSQLENEFQWMLVYSFQTSKLEVLVDDAVRSAKTLSEVGWIGIIKLIADEAVDLDVTDHRPNLNTNYFNPN